MTKAEQRALEAYPEKIVSGPIGHEEDAFDINAFARLIFEEGYSQAEKDLALTWEDIIELEDLMAMVHYEFRNGIGKESFGKEVLEKFNAMKEERQ